MEELSEEQRLALEEKRQRSEKISRLMSPYLLKRYRMLNENCAVCENILLQSPQGLKYCVNCEEVENDKTYPSNSPVQQYSKPTGASPQAEPVLLAKLQTAVTSLHEIYITEFPLLFTTYIIHARHVKGTK
ncbi:protein ZNRD2-like [Dysidea avara]|uniref:protein ZNRD2-like n=1 Tax=Dysidea avara TaxID=196820 RepID=UPI0033255FB4